MKPQDIVVLLKLVSLQQQESDPAELRLLSSARALEKALGVSKTEVNASIKRSMEAGLALKDRHYGYPKANVSPLLEFINHGIRYVFPVKPAELVRGIPTAFGAPELEGELRSTSDIRYVWPTSKGKELGQSIKPLFGSVPDAVEQDARLYTYLALIDAVRLGNPREMKLGRQLLKQKLKP